MQRLVPRKANAPTRVSSTSSSITLKWNPVNEGSVARSYIIAWKISNNGSMLYNYTTTGTSTNIINLRPNTAYDITLVTRNIAGFGQTTDPVTFTSGYLLCNPTLNKVLQLITCSFHQQVGLHFLFKPCFKGELKYKIIFSRKVLQNTTNLKMV